ncbi:MAG: MFS transporter [Holosporales bacterium]|jgi:MHS family proline/betaine transporter-like MFS transporter|nr:MFS transporter [Holosporales bacterium]
MRPINNLGICANALEWVDYSLYGAFSSVMAPLFFPSSSALASQLAAFGVFALGFIARPLGGVFFGHIGDKIGRSKALFLSIALMAIPTTCIGLLPTYAQVGMLAPALLTLLRTLQGLSMGGEFTGSMVSLVENAPVERRGRNGSWADVGCLLGTLVGGQLIVALLSAILGEQAYQTWGWRLPFLLSIGLLYIGMRLRKEQEGTPPKKKSAKMPIVEVVTRHRGVVLWTMCVIAFSGVSFYSLLVFLPNYLVLSGHVSPTWSFCMTGATNACMIPVTLLAGHLTDVFRKRKTFLQVGITGVLLTVYPMTAALHAGALGWYGVLHLLSGLCLSLYFGGRTAFFAEAFPAHVRYTAVSFAFGVAQAIAGGTTPFLATYLIEQVGDVRILSVQFAVAALLALVALSKMPDRTMQPLE